MCVLIDDPHIRIYYDGTRLISDSTVDRASIRLAVSHRNESQHGEYQSRKSTQKARASQCLTLHMLIFGIACDYRIHTASTDKLFHCFHLRLSRTGLAISLSAI